MISTTKPGSLGDNNPLINASQTQSQVNAQPVTRAGVQNGKENKLANGETTIAISGDNLILRQGGAKGTAFEFNISRASTGLLAYQTGLIPPSVATNYPTEGDFGWYEDTTGPTYYWVINHGGTLKNISLSTLTGSLGPTQHGDQSANVTALHAMTQISGTITATQHSNFTAATANDSLHALATTAHPGFLSTAFFDLLNGVTTAATADTLPIRNSSGELNAAAYKVPTSGTALQVVGERATGWALPTGTLVRTTYVTYTSTTSGATYDGTVQANINSMSSSLQQVSRRLGALITDLFPPGSGSHGLIGT